MTNLALSLALEQMAIDSALKQRGAPLSEMDGVMSRWALKAPMLRDPVDLQTWVIFKQTGERGRIIEVEQRDGGTWRHRVYFRHDCTSLWLSRKRFTIDPNQQP